MTQFLAAISTAGEMSFRDIKNECGKEAWAPLVVFTVQNEEGIKKILPLFSGEDVCRKWCKRNLPKEWKLNGGCYLTEEDLKTVEQKGWLFELFKWPRKIKDLVEFSVEPIELISNPEVYVR